MKKELDKELYPDYGLSGIHSGFERTVPGADRETGQKITDRIPQKLGLKKITRNDPEYWGLAGVLPMRKQNWQ